MKLRLLLILTFAGSLLLNVPAAAQQANAGYFTLSPNAVAGQPLTYDTKEQVTVVSPYTKLRNTRVEMDASVAYTNFDFKFKTAALSILRWSSLNVFSLNLGAKLNVKRNGYVSIDGTLGSVQNGYTSDDDVENDLSLISLGRASGSVRNFKIKLGMNGVVYPNGVSMSPYIGYSRKWAKLNMLGHYAPYADPNEGWWYPNDHATKPGEWCINDEGEIEDASCVYYNDSFTDYYCKAVGLGPNCITQQYTAIWTGPLIGVDITKRFNGFDDTLNFTLELHMPYYKGIGNWPLRDNMQHPKSFVDEGWAWGIEAGFNYKQKLNMDWLLNFGVGFEYFTVKNGDTTDYPADEYTGESLPKEFFENALIWAHHRAYSVYIGFTRLLF